MQSTARSLLVSAVLSVAAIAMASALYADDDHVTSRWNMSGMMEGMHMMGGCGAMMRSDNAGRPNDQWRAPRPPDAGGNK